MNTNIPAIQISYILFKEGTLGLSCLPGGVPQNVTKESFVDLSDNAKELMITALRRLALINYSGDVTDQLKDLANSHSVDKWNAQMSLLLELHYSDELKILRTGTPDQLADLVARNYTGSRRNKAVRFLANAAIDIGYTVNIKFGNNHQNAMTSSQFFSNETESMPYMPTAIEPNNHLRDDFLSVCLVSGEHPITTISIPSSIDISDTDLMQALLEVAGIFADRQAESKGGK